MIGFPLIRKKLSNEHFMAGLTVVLLFYLVPRWMENPKTIVLSAILLMVGLLIDSVINFIRFKMMMCAVSAAVTVLVMDILTPEVSIYIKLLGVFFAIALAKHIWGGTGKNIFNPAILGTIFIYATFHLSGTSIMALQPSLLLVPALLFSIPFMWFRPYASVGLMLGMILGLVFRQDLTLVSFVAKGTIFWSCIVITDPVTVTPHPYWGLGLGLFCGFISLGLFNEPFVLVSGVLIINVVSFVVEEYSLSARRVRAHFRLKRVVNYDVNKTRFLDLTLDEEIVRGNVDGKTVRKVNGIANDKIVGKVNGITDDKIVGKVNGIIDGKTAGKGNCSADSIVGTAIVGNSDFQPETILERIKLNGVFGFGGAAFPTWDKIMAVMNSDSKEKHLIINGAECDPGLIHDKWILRHKSSEINNAIELIKTCIDFKTVSLAVKDKTGLSFPIDVKLQVLSDYYPVGAEKKLIREVLGKKLTSEVIPAKEGILVLNVQTVYSIYDAVVKNKPANTRFLTLANLKKGEGVVVKALLRSSVEEIVNVAFPGQGPVFAGGGLMNCHNLVEEETVGKSINFIAVSERPRFKESPQCSGCGSCANNCPEGLKVNRIAELMDNKKFDEVKKYKPEKCIGCGICSYVCPAGKNLSERINSAKLV